MCMEARCIAAVMCVCVCVSTMQVRNAFVCGRWNNNFAFVGDVAREEKGSERAGESVGL